MNIGQSVTIYVLQGSLAFLSIQQAFETSNASNLCVAMEARGGSQAEMVLQYRGVYLLSSTYSAGVPNQGYRH